MKELKLLKGLLKKRTKLTLSTLVIFLITGSIGYGVEIVNDTVIKIDEIINTTDPYILVGNKYHGLTVNTSDSLINSGTISTKLNSIEKGKIIIIDSSSHEANGVFGNVTENNGIISGSLLDVSVENMSNSLDFVIANGVFGDVTKNNGVISGSAFARSTMTTDQSGVLSYISVANGVSGDVTENNGVIFGSAFLMGGMSKTGSAAAILASTIAANGVSGDVNKNNGIISGNAFLMGGESSIDPTVPKSSMSFVSSRGSVANGVAGKVETNDGVISGNAFLTGGIAKSQIEAVAWANAYATANGVFRGVTKNNGVISGDGFLMGGVAENTAAISPYAYAAYASASASATANGVAGDIAENNGVISGNITAESGITIKNGVENIDYVQIKFSGNGVAYDGELYNDIINNGVIKGSQSAIAATSISGSVNNFGILAGREIFSDGNEIIQNDSTWAVQKNLSSITPITENNHGIYIKLKSEMNGVNTTGKIEYVDGKPMIEKVVIGSGGEISGKKILNGYIDGSITTVPEILAGNNNTYINSSNLDKSSDLIINGVGRDNGALVVDVDTSLKDSIINGYETGLFIEGNNRFQGESVVINGGGLGQYSDNGTLGDISDDYFKYENVIQGDSGNNIIELTGNSIVNGSIDLGTGDDMLSISNDTQLNGDLKGGLGNDTLNLGEKIVAKTSSNLNIFHDISGFETVNTNGNVTLFETAKITDGNLNIESGNLTLRVNPLDKDENGNIKGHALYNHSGDINAVNGNLIIGLNGLGVGAIIATNGTTIDKNIDTAYDEESNRLRTNSLVLNATLLEDKNIEITVFEDLPINPPVDPPVDPPINPEPPVDPPAVVDSLLYEKLNKVYQSIVSAGEIGNLANTTLLEDKTYNESLGGLLTILDQIYANNPYAYSLKSSRDSLKLFEDNMSYLTIKPKKDEMIVQGKAIYTGVKNDSSASGKNYYGFDTGHRNYKTTTNTVGGLATFEYGLSDDASVGIVFGGNNQDVNFKGSSKIKGNSLYLGTFAKTDINNFKLMSGVGYQYTSADADRRVSNRYDSFSTGDKYDINSLNAFVEAKYVYSAEQDWTVEPKVRLSYYYIDQDKVNEGYTPGQISMKTDTVNSNTADVEVGVDFVK
ncbi:autotransporter domain-containing protein, partial [Cetobacterium sp.]|uniref:autotransporter domain-containing protein n=1 Tax=Cetobacterium sp. TaxID=2071632 RepID=UPI003F362AB4